ncbi:hypothetical protein AUC43_15235 [Hymenobacter sedentarius]|uniref:Uncharacterized protein n=1 Tax=Hymenobacter sedentarius TaxID=1411621 RepID=A0A0U4ADR7_9BACT|nr:hypothetical protein [Hymenobacter sedentarius]ALW86316.1 hypothetical protein AUC43_15235 [Hymenobacter sedentarius]
MEDSYFDGLEEAVTDYNTRKLVPKQHKYELVTGALYYTSTELTPEQLADQNALALASLRESLPVYEEEVDRFIANRSLNQIMQFYLNREDSKFMAVEAFVQRVEDDLIENLDEDISRFRGMVTVGEPYAQKAEDLLQYVHGAIVELREGREVVQGIRYYRNCQLLLAK